MEMEMDMNNTSCMGGMMTMYFHTGHCEYVLFEKLKTQTAAELFGACTVVFILAGLYEGLKVFREYLISRVGAYEQNNLALHLKPSPTSPTDETLMNHSKTTVAIHMMSVPHIVQTLLHVLQIFVSYCLMLVVMTYNIWLSLSVFLGAGTGYFLFGWKNSVSIWLAYWSIVIDVFTYKCKNNTSQIIPPLQRKGGLTI